MGPSGELIGERLPKGDGVEYPFGAALEKQLDLTGGSQALLPGSPGAKSLAPYRQRSAGTVFAPTDSGLQVRSGVDTAI